MAIKIYEKFAPRANPADGDYPYGSIKNESVPGAKDGTPLDAVWGNDYAGFDAALLAEAGITPSGQPDKLGASQRVEAMRKIFSNVGTVADIAAGNFKVGSIIRVTDRDNDIFKIVSGGTPDGWGVIDAGGVNTAEIQPSRSTSILGFGAVSGLSSGIDNAPAINASITKLGRLVMPIGDFEIRTPVLVPTSTYGVVWEGAGMEKSILRAVNMPTEDGVRLANTAYGPRVQMRDFQVIGDCRHAFNLDTTGATSEMQMCNFVNLRATSNNSAFKAK